MAEKLEHIQAPHLTWKYASEPEEKHYTIFRATKEQAIIWSLTDKQ